MLEISQSETRIHFPPLAFSDFSEHSFGFSGLNIKDYRANFFFYVSSMAFEIAFKGIFFIVIQVVMHQNAQINIDKLIIRVLS